MVWNEAIVLVVKGRERADVLYESFVVVFPSPLCVV
jgi:hypothetical protein